MRRFTEKQYQRQLMIAMVLYVGVMLLAWPSAKTAGSVPLKLALAMLPVALVFYVIGLMARRILHSDELEQRTHMGALGVATAVVGAASLVGGFLAAAKLVQLDGTVLIWVFPLQLFAYGATRWILSRRYGHDGVCGEGGFPFRYRMLQRRYLREFLPAMLGYVFVLPISIILLLRVDLPTGWKVVVALLPVLP